MKRILLSLTLILVAACNVEAQVILTDAEERRGRTVVEGEVPFIPQLGVTYDQYAPLGEGTVLLCCFGAAYLMKKKRKEGL